MLRSLVVVGALAGACRAHISPWMESMYGIPELYPGLQNPVQPLGPGLAFDDWWFRGPGVRAAVPPDGAVTLLPAGGSVTLELACDRYYTVELYGADPNGNVACDWAGPFHADPAGAAFYREWIAGCALGIADVMDPEDATPDNFVVFSVQHECVVTRNTTFEVPAKMPSCTGEWCICGWLWQPQTGDTNAYHTPFRCKVTDSPEEAGTIAFPLQDPVKCNDEPENCTKGAKRMLMLYNEPNDFDVDNRLQLTLNDFFFISLDHISDHNFTSPSDLLFLIPRSLNFPTLFFRILDINDANPPSLVPRATHNKLQHSSTSSFPVFFPAPTATTMTTSQTTRTTTTTSAPHWFIATPAAPSSSSSSSSLVWVIAPTGTPSSPSASSTTTTSSPAQATPTGRLSFRDRQALAAAAQGEAAAARLGRRGVWAQAAGRMRERMKRGLRGGEL
ncbi:hypothetical protein JCM6882_007926 [Rhodosporidiobolus microsporus]